MLSEPGTEHARDLFLSAHRVRSSRVLIPEAYAAIERAFRGGRLGISAVERSREAARIFLAEVQSIEVHAALAERAASLATRHGLRGFDSVHLASYEIMETEASLLVAADGELVHAALADGHAVAVPG